MAAAAVREVSKPLLHLVAVDGSALTPEDRAALPGKLARLGEIPFVRVSVGRHPIQADAVVLLVSLPEAGALERYRTHPTHVAVTEWLRAAGAVGSKVEIGTAELSRHLQPRPEPNVI